MMWLLSCQVKLAVSQWLFLWFVAGDELLCDVGQVPGDVAVVLSGEAGGGSVAVPVVCCG